MRFRYEKGARSDAFVCVTLAGNRVSCTKCGKHMFGLYIMYFVSDCIKANSNQLSFKINQLKLNVGVFGRLSVAADSFRCYSNNYSFSLFIILAVT